MGGCFVQKVPDGIEERWVTNSKGEKEMTIVQLYSDIPVLVSFERGVFTCTGVGERMDPKGDTFTAAINYKDGRGQATKPRTEVLVPSLDTGKAPVDPQPPTSNPTPTHNPQRDMCKSATTLNFMPHGEQRESCSSCPIIRTRLKIQRSGSTKTCEATRISQSSSPTTQ
eukprot:2187923-Rhodomonas_salina.1